MTLNISLGEISVPSTSGERLLEICIVWLDKTAWEALPIDRQKAAYAFIERYYSAYQMFYCFKKTESAYEINFVRGAHGDEKKISEDTLKKIFLKYVQPLIQKNRLTAEAISIPRLK